MQEIDATLHPRRDLAQPVIRKDPSGKPTKVRHLPKAKSNAIKPAKVKQPKVRQLNPRWITATRGVTSMVVNPVGNGKRR